MNPRTQAHQLVMAGLGDPASLTSPYPVAFGHMEAMSRVLERAVIDMDISEIATISLKMQGICEAAHEWNELHIVALRAALQLRQEE